MTTEEKDALGLPRCTGNFLGDDDVCASCPAIAACFEESFEPEHNNRTDDPDERMTYRRLCLAQLLCKMLVNTPEHDLAADAMRELTKAHDIMQRIRRGAAMQHLEAALALLEQIDEQSEG